jgi:hypothetical protein
LNEGPFSSAAPRQTLLVRCATQAEAQLWQAQRAGDERNTLAAQVQRLLTEVEAAHEGAGRAAGSHGRVAALETQCDTAQRELLATAAMVQRLEARVRRERARERL